MYHPVPTDSKRNEKSFLFMFKRTSLRRVLPTDNPIPLSESFWDLHITSPFLDLIFTSPNQIRGQSFTTLSVSLHTLPLLFPPHRNFLYVYSKYCLFVVDLRTVLFPVCTPLIPLYLLLRKRRNKNKEE